MNHDPTTHHPNHETWIDYHAGEVPAAEAERLRAHLAGCRRCCDLVLDVDAFADPPIEDGSGVADLEKAAVWRAMQKERRARWTTAAALAASAVFAVAGLLAWSDRQRTVERLEDRIAELSGPQGDAVILDLDPSSRQRAAGGPPAVVDLPAEAAVTLVLNLAEPADHADFELEIRAVDGTEIWSSAGLRPSEFDNFYLTLPAGSLPAGGYELLLFGLDGDRKDLLEIYPVRLIER